MARAFVVGFPRSGTTIVQAMLARHPDVFTFPETSFFEHAIGDLHVRCGDARACSDARLHHRLGFAHGASRRTLNELAATLDLPLFAAHIPARLGPRIRRFVALLDCATAGRGATTWVEKTPNHVYYLDAIAHFVPDARVVHVIRNGTDALASILDARMTYGETVFGGALETWVQRWNRAMVIHAAYARLPNHLLLRYDDLVADPLRSWNAIARFTGLRSAALQASGTAQIADPLVEPWKAAALGGMVRPPANKVAQIFGPRMLRWLSDSLLPIDDLVGSAPRTEFVAPESNLSRLVG